MPKDTTKYSDEDIKKGKGCFYWFSVGCLSIIAIPVVLFALLATFILISETINPTKSTSSISVATPTPVPPSTQPPDTSITYYLAVNSSIPAPEDPVPVADYETMQALVRAAESKDQEKYSSLLQSPSVSLVYGGGIVSIQDRKDGLVKVEIMGKSVNGDISGQTRWVSEKFIQSRQF